MNKLKYILLSSSIILSSCASQEPAPIEFGTPLERGVSISSKKSNQKEISSKKFEFDNYQDKNDKEENVLRDQYKNNNRYISEDSNNPEQENQTHISNTEQNINEEKPNEDKLESELENLANSKKTDNKQEIEKIETNENISEAKPQEKQENNSLENAPQEEIVSEKILSYPVNGKVINKFGDIVNGAKNNGINFSGDSGDPVRAAGSGVVERVINDNKFGNTIIIKHSNSEIQTAYAHLSTTSVEKGQIVTEGEVIGALGQTGEAEVPMLHFAVRKGKNPVNPIEYLK